VRALAVIDGEHYAEVVRQALEELPYDFVAAFFAGGNEKLRGGESYGVPLATSLEDAVAEYLPEIVVDLSDEPVLGPAERFRLASRALALGLPYVGADFRFDPPSFVPIEVPSIAVIGTGKRVGKTAVTGKLARLAAETRDVVVVSMGRGGPPEPELVESPPAVDELVARSRAGAHAASDYLETAVVAGVVTVGCRRCGGGLAGEAWVSNVLEGVALAASRRPELIVCDGSGAAVPPVAADARVLVASALQGADVVTGYLNAYRILISDLVVVTMAEAGAGAAEIRHRIQEVKSIPVVACELRLRPLEPLAARRTAVFTAGPAPTDHLDAEIVHVSKKLADRAALREELATVDAEVYLVEIKAAGIDVVADTARARGAEVVFADNEPVPLPGEPDLEAELRSLVEAVLKEPAVV
jgi:cyclic 2,3-diphosphoglycerate synthetase